jgi:hypothetical protein
LVILPFSPVTTEAADCEAEDTEAVADPTVAVTCSAMLSATAEAASTTDAPEATAMVDADETLEPAWLATDAAPFDAEETEADTDFDAELTDLVASSARLFPTVEAVLA